ncbi:MAG: FUSC family protein [Solidesulfovibrio sp. DCME]|uniref:FUSC family protein n=1 Tax=Solidesulfovibrio sp. DCME TaxID=3447380 RepID=UPI003D1286AE
MNISLRFHRPFLPALPAQALRGLLLALRGAVVFMVPFSVGLALGSPRDAVFAAFAAHSIALVDVAGSYALRCNLLCLLALAFAGSAALGCLAAGSLPGAVLATGLLGLSVGAWRQVCRDYGPMAAVPCALVFFTALGLTPLGTPMAALAPAAVRHGLSTLAGGLFGVACLLAYWPLRPHAPLRRLVGRNWLGLAGLARCLAAGLDTDDAAVAARFDAEAAQLRTTLDAAFAQLAPLAGRQAHPFWGDLEAANLAAARFITRLVGLRALLSGQAALAEADLPAALRHLAVAAHTVAQAVVRPRPGSRRIATDALDTARRALARAAAAYGAAAARPGVDGRLASLLAESDCRFGQTQKALRRISRPDAGRAAWRGQWQQALPWRDWPLRGTFALPGRLDAALVRYTLGLSALLMAATAAFKGLGLPHGAWLPFSMLVVLQPSAGLTRSRMLHRICGTVAGALVAGLPLWRTLPLPGLLAVIAASCAVFTYLMRRHYGTAVFFITLTVVLMTGLDASAPWPLALERLGCVVAGSLAAWAVARALWAAPSEARVRALLAEAFEANRRYLDTVRNALAVGGDAFHDASVAAKRRAERADRSLRAVLAQWRQAVPGAPSRAALEAMTASCSRLTGLVTVLFLQQEADPAPVQAPEVALFVQQALEILDFLAGDRPAQAEVPEFPTPPAGGQPPHLRRQLADIRDTALAAAACGA